MRQAFQEAGCVFCVIAPYNPSASTVVGGAARLCLAARRCSLLGSASLLLPLPIHSCGPR
ncbi:hypothetical protein INR49_016238 [Caranx melampygus]|nr:hypothetical protein INR49_016238 [Caranx melampygus]